MQDCEKIISIINNRVLNKDCCSYEARAFFLKTIGDYYRYMAEIARDAKLEEVKQKTKISYEEAYSIDLPPCTPIKLSLALNFSKFNHDVLDNRAKAIELTKNALQ